MKIVYQKKKEKKRKKAEKRYLLLDCSSMVNSEKGINFATARSLSARLYEEFSMFWVVSGWKLSNTIVFRGCWSYG